MAQVGGIDTIVGRLEAWIKSPEGKLDLAKSGVKVAQTILRLSVQAFIGQNMRSLWENLRGLRNAVACLKKEAINFTIATGKGAPPEIITLITNAEADVKRYASEISKLPEQSRQLMNMVFTI